MTTAKRNTFRNRNAVGTIGPLSVCKGCNALLVGGAFLSALVFDENNNTRRHSKDSLPCGHILFVQERKIHIIFHKKSLLSSNLSPVDANSHTSIVVLPRKMAAFSFCRPIETLTSSTSQTEHIFVFHQRVLFAIDPVGSKFKILTPFCPDNKGRRSQVLSIS